MQIDTYIYTYLSIHLSIYLSISIYLSFYLSIYIYRCVCVSLETCEPKSSEGNAHKYSYTSHPKLPVLSQVIFGEPADLGFHCVSRRRAFTVLVDRSKGQFIADPNQVYKALCHGLGDRHLSLEELVKLGSQAFLEKELALTGKSLNEYPDNLLTELEKEHKGAYEKALDETRPGEAHSQQAYCLNQNPECVSKMSTDGVLPAYTKSDRMTWLRHEKRHLLAIEKFASHSYGVNAELANLLGIPVA